MNAIELINEPKSGIVNSTATVLIIDADAGESHTIEQLLESQNHRTVCATDAEQAMSTLLFVEPQAIVIDASMELDGVPLIQSLRDCHDLKDVPVIALCSTGDLHSGVRCVEYGADDLMLKPLNPALLEARLDTLIKQRREGGISQQSPMSRSYDAMREAFQVNDTLEKLVADTQAAAAMDPWRVGRCLENLHRNHKTLPQQIHRIRDYAQMKLGRYEPNRTRHDVGQLVLAIAEAVAKESNTNRPAIRWKDFSNGARAWLDDTLTEYVVRRLLSKALKYGVSEILISIEIYNGNVMLSIEDDGPGIPEKHREEILRRGNSPAARSRGQLPTLGLPFCKLASETQGGRLWIDDSSIGGNAFRLSLPRFKNHVD